MHSSENYTLEQLQKHFRIEEESMARDKNDNSYEGTSKANAVEKIEHSTKSNKRKTLTIPRRRSKLVVSCVKNLGIMQKNADIGRETTPKEK
jgi:hypothetical protein